MTTAPTRYVMPILAKTRGNETLTLVAIRSGTDARDMVDASYPAVSILPGEFVEQAMVRALSELYGIEPLEFRDCPDYSRPGYPDERCYPFFISSWKGDVPLHPLKPPTGTAMDLTLVWVPRSRMYAQSQANEKGLLDEISSFLRKSRQEKES